MEEKKEKKKISKVYIVIFTLAIVSAILGVFDLKANAAELTEEIPYLNVTYSNYWNENYPYSVPNGYIYPDFDGHLQSYDLDNTRLYALMRIPYTSSDGTIIKYYYSLYNGDGVGYFTNNEQPCSYVPTTYEQYTYVKDGDDTFYESVTYSTNASTFTVYVAPELEVNNARIIDATFETNIPIFEDYNAMTTYLKTGVLEGNIIDYGSLGINGDIGVVDNLKVNKLNDSKFFDNQVIYDYLTWSNTENFDLQIEFQPVVKIYSDSKFEIYLREYVGEWSDIQILASGTSSYLCAMDVLGTTVNSDEIVNSETWEYFKNIYGNADYYDWSGFDAEYPEFCYRYRIRYVDKENSKAGRWVYVNPSMLNGKYESYVEELDNSHSILDDSLDGTNVDIGDIGLEAGMESVENENNFKDKYETVDNQADVQEVSNWLKTVANFISGTPNVVASVLSFLPQPILYGMYVCIFLGVIASGFAIIRALI